VRVAFDTSVLVAALIEPHIFHHRALRWLEEAASERLAAECTWHAVAETWSVLTRLPIEPPVSPAMGEAAVARLLERLEPVAIDSDVYRQAMRRCSDATTGAASRAGSATSSGAGFPPAGRISASLL
jgi:predicted nucleic acid-binding protein